MRWQEEEEEEVTIPRIKLTRIEPSQVWPAYHSNASTELPSIQFIDCLMPFTA